VTPESDVTKTFTLGLPDCRQTKATPPSGWGPTTGAAYAGPIVLEMIRKNAPATAPIKAPFMFRQPFTESEAGWRENRISDYPRSAALSLHPRERHAVGDTVPGQ
jgi:hypothetical protein